VNTEERHRLVIEAVAEGIYEWSTETNHLELSPRLKQHGGSIEVDTKPSEFTEIKVLLPRVAALLPERD
jgi:hypothetical protein